MFYWKIQEFSSICTLLRLTSAYSLEFPVPTSFSRFIHYNFSFNGMVLTVKVTVSRKGVFVLQMLFPWALPPVCWLWARHYTKPILSYLIIINYLLSYVTFMAVLGQSNLYSLLQVTTQSIKVAELFNLLLLWKMLFIPSN